MNSLFRYTGQFFFSGVILLILMGCLGGSSFARESSDSFESFPDGKMEAARLRPGVEFLLSVEVNGRDEIEQTTLRVNENGTSVLPIIGAVDLDGLTLAEASGRLTALYEPYYVETPLVRMQFFVDETGGSSPWGYVTVLGRVLKPGRVSLPPTRDLTVSGAIQGADGLDTSANLSAVRVTRFGKDNQKQQIKVNLNRVGKDGDAEQDLRLQAGDVVFVPERIF